MRLMGLMLRHRIYYLRRSIPLALRSFADGRREVLKSLRTSDLQEARVLSLKANLVIEDYLQELTRRLKRSRGPVPSPTELAQLHERESLKSPETGDMDERQQEALSLAYSDRYDAMEDPRRVSKLLTDVLNQHGLYLTPSQRPAYERELKEADQRVMKTLDRRFSKPEQNLSGLLAAYLGERKLGSKSAAEVTQMWTRFSQHVHERPVKEVTKAMCRNWKVNLLSSGLAGATCRKLLSMVATIWRYAEREGIVDTNPMAGLTRIIRTSDAKPRAPFTDEEVRLLIADLPRSGARKFVPLIAFYSGLRLEEIAGLRVQDVKTEQGVTYFDLIAAPGRPLKTSSSQRKVPVHPELIAGGLLELVRPKGQTSVFLPNVAHVQLFPDLEAGPHGRYGAAVGKWFATFCGKHGIDKSLHHARHGVTDKLRASGTQEAVIAALLGHSGVGMTSKYGRGWDLATLATAIASIRY